LARAADRHRPVLHRRTAEGERVDEVEFHPSYRALQAAAREHRVFTASWHPLEGHERVPRTLGFALGYLYAQAECGYYCPACMTDGAAFVLTRHAPPALRDALVPRLLQLSPEGAYEGAMYLTEKGGGSDVGGGTETRAEQASDGTWRLMGEKWFASNCVADVALALARMPDGAAGTAGLGLFVVPRRLPNGTPNPGLRIERLKEKLGVTSMPTGEVLLEGAVAHLVAPAPAGFRAMAEMVNLSRLYNAVASVALARRALREGVRAATHREAFGRRLADQPLFLRALTALALEVEGALGVTLDTAAVFDRYAAGDAEAGRLLRVLTPCAKAMTAKLAVRAASEACEMLGGVGYIEEYVTPRLLRDAQVLPIWEGTTNVQLLEFLRALEKGGVEAFAAHVRPHVDPAPFLQEAARLATLNRDARELAAPRLMHLCYHLHAQATLRAAAPHATDPARAERVAALYGAVALATDTAAAEQALGTAVLAKEGGLPLMLSGLSGLPS
ncbi:MAG TPA: acyl-CoA dehydrogenase family protein, partial [Candidatus Thermoplasmatota archaeon]|nr:acyl-CoA dehydrogenase family protein [Candidatus Thermoplasmatota archaeon]